MLQRVLSSALPVLLAACTPAHISSPYSQEAQDLIRTCRYDEARPLLEARLASSKGDQHIATLLQLGSLEENSGNLAQAVVHYRAALAQTRPETRLRDSANVMLGMAAVRIRDYATAMASLRESAHYRSRPATRISVGWEQHAALGIALAESGHYEEARSYFERALKLVSHPESVATRSALSSWRQAADELANRQRSPVPDFFWQTAYGTAAALTGPNRHYDLVPIARVTPHYPSSAQKSGITGFVEVEVSVDEQGRPSNLHVLRSAPPGVFDQAALVAMRQWRFQPRIENCQAVPHRGAQRIEFDVPENRKAKFDAQFDEGPFPGPDSPPGRPHPRERN